MAAAANTMPSAVPGVGECRICFECVPCVKVLDCSHTVCIPCATKLFESPNDCSITCPECRQHTDCHRGLRYLKTRYFGKIRCDVCLEKKDASDMWWCADCVMAFCSKCSITEHAQKKHTISEWNNMEPVQFSVDYINDVKYARQTSTNTEYNKKAVHSFVSKVAESLEARLQNQPELDDLKESLLERYGMRFSVDETPNSAAKAKPRTNSSGSSESSEGGPKIVAKCLQLAGANIAETILPTVNDQKFQVYFTVTPDEVADYLKSKIEFIPFDKDYQIEEEQEKNSETASRQAETEEKSIFTEVEIDRLTPKVPVMQVHYSPTDNIIALRTGTEVQLYCLVSNRKHSIPMPSKQLIKNICLKTGELLVVLQSSTKKWDWFLECYQISSLPVTGLYSSEFDIDPEDSVDAVLLSMTGENGSAIYEIRWCARHVSEVWRVIPSKKKGKVKLKETLLYQHPNARLSALDVVEPKGAKEKFLFAWDELSSCLFRLIIKDGRCEHSTKVLHSSEPIPFFLDMSNYIWLFDPHLHQFCVSKGSVLNRVNVTFDTLATYKKHGFCGIWAMKESIIAFTITNIAIRMVSFPKFCGNGQAL